MAAVLTPTDLLMLLLPRTGILAIAAVIDSALHARGWPVAARALASSGDRRSGVEARHLGERLHDQGDPGTEPAWISYFDQQEVAGEAAHCFRDLHQANQTSEFAALAVESAHTPARTRAFIQLVSAAGVLIAGNPDEAVSLAQQSVTLAAGSLQSARYLKYLTDFHGSFDHGRGRPRARRIPNATRGTANPRMQSSPSARALPWDSAPGGRRRFRSHGSMWTHANRVKRTGRVARTRRRSVVRPSRSLLEQTANRLAAVAVCPG